MRKDVRPPKRFMRFVMERRLVPGTSPRKGQNWLALLSCGHWVRMTHQRGLVAKKAHCLKCELGLVPAEPAKLQDLDGKRPPVTRTRKKPYFSPTRG